MNITDLIARAKVLLTSVLTWLTVAAAVLTFVAQQLDSFEGIPKAWVRGIVTVAGVLSFIVLQVRSHTPVGSDQKGLLPPQGPATPTLEPGGTVHDPDAGELTLTDLLAIVAVALIVYFLLRWTGVF